MVGHQSFSCLLLPNKAGGALTFDGDFWKTGGGRRRARWSRRRNCHLALASDSTEPRPELSSLTAENDGQRRQNIDVSGVVWLAREGILGGDCRTEQTLLTVGSIL